jgi:L,D-peptidoglycan transpeptidase YkuD (ErfK/YbiS/YcfS/YnhG family)
MNFEVHADGAFLHPGGKLRCALGKGGVAAMGAKREGDGATPAGLWPLRRLFYRPDRMDAPKTRLPIAALKPTDGWCDAPGDPAYNQAVTLPYPASAEHLWREDGAYDLIVVLGYNDAPVVPGRGSAIFLHVARPDYSPTEGCVALAKDDLLEVLANATPWDALCIHAAPPRAA